MIFWPLDGSTGPAALACGAAMLPVTSGDTYGTGAACGTGCGAGSTAAGGGAISDCLPIGVGDVIDGVAGTGAAGLVRTSAGSGAFSCSGGAE